MSRFQVLFVCGAALDMIVRRVNPAGWLAEYAYQVMWLCIAYSVLVVLGVMCMFDARKRPVGAAALGGVLWVPLLLRWSLTLDVPGPGQAAFAVPVVTTLLAAYRVGRQRAARVGGGGVVTETASRS